MFYQAKVQIKYFQFAKKKPLHFDGALLSFYER